MSALNLVLSIAVPVGLIMVGLVYYARRQQKAICNHNQAILIRQRIDELLEALEFLYQIEDAGLLHEQLLERASYLHQKAIDIEPDDEERHKQATSFNKVLWLERLQIPDSLVTFLRNDNELRQARQHISRCIKIFSSMSKTKKISQGEYQDYRTQLRIRLLELQVNTFRKQGDAARAADDIATASDYYTAAKSKLMEFDLPYSRKNDLLREINQENAALYRTSDDEETSALAEGISREASADAMDESGFPISSEGTKRKF